MMHYNLIELRLRVEAYLVEQGYEAKCVERYKREWDFLQDFMKKRCEEFYTPEIGKEFLEDLFANERHKHVPDWKKQQSRYINVLNQMAEYGFVRNCVIHKDYVFKGPDGQLFNDFIVTELQSLAISTVRRHTKELYWLYKWLEGKQCRLQDMTVQMMMEYVIHLNASTTLSQRNDAMSPYRSFIKYLCERNLLSDNRQGIWLSVLRKTSTPVKKLPAVYTIDEVEKILKAFDRCNPTGKRNYAMTLLAARHAMRASDIVSLRFCNLDWVNNKVIVVTQKRKKTTINPLTEEIGSAIIDYLRFGRPKVKSQFVFLKENPPYGPLKPGTFATYVANAMTKADINIGDRKVGPHVLRHSLASNLLKEGESLPVISGILGHQSTESTKTYLRVDINMLKCCALDVPFVSSTFYDNMCE